MQEGTERTVDTNSDLCGLCGKHRIYYTHDMEGHNGPGIAGCPPDANCGHHPFVERTVATLVDKLRTLSLEIEGLGYSRARAGWHETVRESADALDRARQYVKTCRSEGRPVRPHSVLEMLGGE
jgi:hypothetical protein